MCQDFWRALATLRVVASAGKARPSQRQKYFVHLPRGFVVEAVGARLRLFFTYVLVFARTNYLVNYSSLV